jgi:anti-anti-sigma factor
MVRLDVVRLDQVTIARITGAIDASNVGDLEQGLAPTIPNDALGLVVDLTATTYIDSTGIRLLFDLSERLGWRGQTLRLVLPANAPIRRILAITRLDTLVPVDPDCDTAVAQLSSAAR